MARSKSSKRWLKEHFDDHHVKMAQRDGYRSRAVYKLIEINEKDRLIKPGQIIVDLGAAPGGWSQYAGRVVGSRGHVFALDILPMDTLEDVTFIEGDFREDGPYQELLNALGDRQVDLVISDMAPNLAGNKAIDQPRAMYLAELALEFSDRALKPGGDFLVKVFQGEGFQEYLAECRKRFKKVITRKPDASRGKSRELYVLGRGCVISR